MSRELKVTIPAVFAPLCPPSRYKAAHGGRGSGKSRFFAQAIVLRSLDTPGLRVVCIREVQQTLAQSSKRLIEDTISGMGLTGADGFKSLHDRIELPGGGLIIFQGMQTANADSIKSLEGFHIAWVEEAQTLSQHSLDLLRPTIRADDSELWFSWNARRKHDPVDLLFRSPAGPPSGSVVVNANWRDNPFFPIVLEAERQDCLRLNPDSYDHIWEGGFVGISANAYYAASINAAKAEGRIGHVDADPLLTYRACFDIGGTGAKADHVAIWIAQIVGEEVRAIDHYEAQGQPLATHVAWMQSRGYVPGNCNIFLPHDGTKQDFVFDASFAGALRSAGYFVEVIPNQGTGAAMKRVEVGRRMFPRIHFNSPACDGGLEALAWYHEKLDPARQIGLGPEHDWSSDSADGFGLMCIVAEEHFATAAGIVGAPIDYSAVDAANLSGFGKPPAVTIALADEQGRPIQQWGSKRGQVRGATEEGWGAAPDYGQMNRLVGA